jgi:hypothetical protein
MTIITGHGSDAVADSGNEKARWAGTHRARFVFTYCCPAGLLLTTAKTSVTATPFRCMDGIGILRHRP